MRALADGWQSSGLTKQAYSRSCGVSYKIFLYWYRKYYPIKERSGKRTTSPSFHELEVKHPVSKSASGGTALRVAWMELQLSDGRVLVFYEAVDSSFLKAILYY